MKENITKSDINLNLNELNRKLEEAKKEGQKKFELIERLRERLKKLQDQEDIVMAEKRDYYEKEEETRTKRLKI